MGEDASNTREEFKLVAFEGVLDSDMLLSDANLLLLLACAEVTAFGGCEVTITALAALARAPDEKFATADGAKNFTLPVSGADLRVVSRVSEGFAEGVGA